jgi:isopenicillin-N N-acyltransferase-like protein
MDYVPFPLVELTGNPRERGRQHGQAVPDRIKRGIQMYSESLLKNGVDWKHLEQRANAMVPVVEKFDPTYVEEMRGIADGAGVSFAGVMLMNARTEMVAAARKQQAHQHFPDGCTAAFALPEATAGGMLLHGQNWDWRAECADTGVVLRIRRDDGPDILTFTEAGGLARSGLNSAGIGLTANALECDRDYQRGPACRCPSSAARCWRAPISPRRCARSSRRPSSAPTTWRSAIAAARPSASNARRTRRSGWRPSAASTSMPIHWIADAARARVKDTGIQETPCSIYRDKRVREHLRPSAASSRWRISARPSSTTTARRGRSAGPPRPNNRGKLVATSAMILMRPGEGHLEACPMPALNKQFTTYTLTPDQAAQKQAAE